MSRIEFWRAAASAIALAAALAACGRKDESLTVTFDDCETMALLNDYDTVRAVSFHAGSRSIKVRPIPGERVIAQAIINCAQQNVVIATNFPPGHAPRSSIAVYAATGHRDLSISEGINGLLDRGSELLIVTAQQKRASVDQQLGALTSKEVDPRTGDHLFTELLVIDQGLREKRRLRYPMPAYEWVVGDEVVTLGAAVLRMDLRSGKRDAVYDFSSSPDFPFAVTSFHLINGALFAVIGSKTPNPTSFPLSALLRLDEQEKTWKVLSKELPEGAVLAVNSANQITVFGRSSIKIFDERGAVVASGPLPARDGLLVRAAVPVKGAMLVLLMQPDAQAVGTFDPEATIVALADDLTVLASTKVEGVGNAPMLSSSRSASPSGGRYGFLGPVP